eukprot:GHVT01068922.1.p2 GENE.GHVT01068922.1~~GHVT01068922.1.p2  ORF type:complete len:175 (+),score=7.77 GHVT01068922.1:2272-2796(+)
MASQIALRYVSFFGSLNDPDKFFVSLCERTALTNEKSARTFLAQPREELWNAIRSTLKDTKKLQEHNRKLKNQEERLNKLIQILPLWRYELHLENAINKLLLADKGQCLTALTRPIAKTGKLGTKQATKRTAKVGVQRSKTLGKTKMNTTDREPNVKDEGGRHPMFRYPHALLL